MPAIRRRAWSMSRRLGAEARGNPWFPREPPPLDLFASVKLEHLLHDLADRGQRVELAALHLVEQPAQLGVVGNGVLQMRLRPRRRNCEHLAGQVAPPPRLQLVVLLKEAPMSLQLLP